MYAHENDHIHSTSGKTQKIDLYTGEGVSLGGVLFPHLHAAGVVGASTADEIESLAGGHHDPQADFTVQSLEVGASLRMGEHLQGFVVYSSYTDADYNFDGSFEEAFVKLRKLPGDFELRGGRFYNRFGFQNASHNHGWDFVNQNLPNARQLVEGHLATDGGELTWQLPTSFRSAFSFSVGEAYTHKHHHHHEHGRNEPLFEADGAAFEDMLYGGHFVAQLDYNDFYQNRITLSAAHGDNAFGRSTTLLGVGYELLWRQNGYTPGGTYLRWRTEGIYRRIGAEAEESHEHAHEHYAHGHDHSDMKHDHSKHDHEDRIARKTLDDYGLSTSLVYGFNDRLEAGVRLEWISALSEMGLSERFRVSPAFTVALNAQRTLFTRVQFDWDQIGGGEDEYSVWLQVGFNWGGPEVR